MLRRGIELGSDALQSTAFATEPVGLWQFWTLNLALILLIAAVNVVQARPYYSHQGYLEKTNRLDQALITRYKRPAVARQFDG